jgi:hypothetical protein
VSWRTNCQSYLAELDEQMPEGITLAERKKRLRQAAWQFHGGTSWGKKIWGQESRAYLARHGQTLPRAPSPRLLAAMESGDITFPFRRENASS